MAYITNANFRRITRELNVPKDKNFKFDDIIIWESPNGKTIDKNNPSIFGWWEVNDLLAFKEFCKDAKMAVKHFYKKIEKPQDSYRYIDAERCPAYHCDINCEAMHSPFHRIEIPEIIREQGQEKVKVFRTWWKNHEALREEKPDAFVAQLNLVFHTDLRDYEVEDRSNSGVHEMDDNRSVEEINDNIRRLFFELLTWAKEDKDRLNIFLKYKRMSFLWNRDIYTELGKYSEHEIKEVLAVVHSKKEEIIEELKKLYQRRYIPELSFQTTLLENLGFVPCYTCMSGTSNNPEEK